jgi:hypothetical protein
MYSGINFLSSGYKISTYFLIPCLRKCLYDTERKEQISKMRNHEIQNGRCVFPNVLKWQFPEEVEIFRIPIPVFSVINFPSD